MSKPFTMKDVVTFLTNRPSYNGYEIRLVNDQLLHIRDQHGEIVETEEAEPELTDLLNGRSQQPTECLVVKNTTYDTFTDQAGYKCYRFDHNDASGVWMGHMYSYKNEILIRVNSYTLSHGYYYPEAKSLVDPVSRSITKEMEWLAPQTPLFRLPLITGAWKL